MSQHRCLMIGAGGMARHWIRSFIPTHGDRLQISALVDVSENALHDSADFLQLPAARRFTDYREALSAGDFDIAIVVIPPAFHTDVVSASLEAGLDVLCEKPIADTWDKCLAMQACQQRTGRKVQIIQNYRYTERILTFQQPLLEERLGKLNYLVGRFAADYRVRGVWGAFRHEIDHALLVEGSVHHLDQLRNLAGADCATIAGWDWNPSWSSFDGESSGIYVMTMANGVRALYEGNCSEAGWQNNWHGEFYRAECERGAVVLDNDNQVKLLEHRGRGELAVTELEPIKPQYATGHEVQIGQFLDWLDGGEEPDTVLRENLKTAAMLFAAIRASETGQTVDVAGMQ